MFILTDLDYFYKITNDKTEEVPIKSDYLSDKFLKDFDIKFQSEEIESQIWTSNNGTHVIFKYKNITFYYNALLKPAIQNLELMIIGNTILQPYAIAFNECFDKPTDTGNILMSDYNSTIYELKVNLTEKNEMIRLFGQIFEFNKKKETNEKKDNNNEDVDLNFFEIEKNDRILDIKILTSGSITYPSNPEQGIQFENIFIFAITKNMLFQFQGKDTYKSTFEEISKSQFLNCYKFTSIIKKDHYHSRIQIFNQSNEFFLGFKSPTGYIIGNIGSGFEPKIAKEFKVIKYKKPIKGKPEMFTINEKSSEDKKEKNVMISVCYSGTYIFYLYEEFLVIYSRLTGRFIHIEYLKESFIDMYYNSAANEIILYNDSGIYKITLEITVEDNIELGNYDIAIKSLKKDDKLKPKLHKINAERLFAQKEYLEAALEYVRSDETFEHVCIKFLLINNVECLLIYLYFMYNTRFPKETKENRDKNRANNDKLFISRYLIITWILELLIEKNENTENNLLKGIIKYYCRAVNFGADYLNSTFIYFILRILGKDSALIDYSSIIKNYDEIFLNLLNYNNLDSFLSYITAFCNDGIKELQKKMKKIFFKYASRLIRDRLEKSINIIKNYFINEDCSESLIRLFTTPDYKFLSNQENEKDYKIIHDFILNLINSPIKKEKGLNFQKNPNLHNLYILLLSYKRTDEDGYGKELIQYLKKPIDDMEKSKKKNKEPSGFYYDLHFSKIVFSTNENENVDKTGLCLISFLLKQYTQSIDISIDMTFSNSNFESLIFYLAKKIPDVNLKKKIYLHIFEKFREKKTLEESKIVIKESGGIIKIEDILPLIGDDVKINEFKSELLDCIENYEYSEKQLEKELKEFDEANNLINKDIDISEKKVIKMDYYNLRCHKCQRPINDSKVFMFPCKHIFDTQCLIDSYNDFSSHDLGNEQFLQKVKLIKKLKDKWDYLNTKREKALEEERKLKEQESEEKLDKKKGGFFSTKPKDTFTAVEKANLKYLEQMLYQYLSEECLLCGNEMIKSIQVEFEEDFDQNMVEKWENW